METEILFLLPMVFHRYNFAVQCCAIPAKVLHAPFALRKGHISRVAATGKLACFLFQQEGLFLSLPLHHALLLRRLSTSLFTKPCRVHKWYGNLKWAT